MKKHGNATGGATPEVIKNLEKDRYYAILNGFKLLMQAALTNIIDDGVGCRKQADNITMLYVFMTDLENELQDE